MSLLTVSGISKKEDDVFVLRNIHFVQEPFQKIALAGATGSGKTTLLKIIAGLTHPDAGQVLFENERVKGPRERLLPGHPHMAYLSQEFELRNHYRVKELLLMANHLPDQDASIVFEVCRIDHLLNRWSNELSGGERQRIALARLLLAAPRLLLLDEPFSNLDAIHRNMMKQVLADIGEQLKLTCILVSHDSLDLLSWADEIMVLDRGTIIQRDTPEELYAQPLNEYVAGLFGAYNSMTPSLATLFPIMAHHRFVRPEEFVVVPQSDQAVAAEVTRARFMGGYYEMDVRMGPDVLIIRSDRPVEPGSSVYLSVKK